VRLAALLIALLLAAPAAFGQGARIPTEAVDRFHAALRAKNTAGALSMLDRGLVVFEFGVVDPTVEAYGLRHMPWDMDLAGITTWKLETRRVGGEGNERWVLSTYRVTGKQTNGKLIDQTTLETVILRRSGELFRIVHFHWSTNDAAFQAEQQGQRTSEQAPPESEKK